MKKLRSGIAAVVLAVILMVYPVDTQVYAQTYMDYYNNSMQAYEAGHMISSVFELILNEYAGGEVDIKDIYYAALRGLSETLDDYSLYLSEEEYLEFVKGLEADNLLYGIVVSYDDFERLVVSTVMHGSSAEENGVAVGDVIIAVNEKIVSGKAPSEAIAIMNERQDGETDIIIERGGQELSFHLVKSQVKNETVLTYSFDEIYEDLEIAAENFRYVRIPAVGEDTANELEAAVAGMVGEGVTGIVLDLRDNGGGYFEVAVDVCKLLVPKGAILYQTSNTGPMKTVYSDLEAAPFDQIVVLTNSNTASAAEIICSALQDAGFPVVGQNTYGKGVIQSLYEMPDGGVFKLTTGEYYRRSGEKLNTIGITPDVFVDMPSYVSVSDSPQDMINIKKLLAFLGYETGALDGEYDETTREAVIQFKADMNAGLTLNDTLDTNTILILNEALYNEYMETDVALEAALDLLTGI